ncbi:MAG: GNAT family N-acetyltransferase [Ruminococcaceae bacterium]|nr:GNAT family N-acetyltransferase [Oscillospiraceae bacterium]
MNDFFETSGLQDGEIKLHLLRTAQADPERGWLPAYHFEIHQMDGTKVGFCDLRVGHNEKSYYGGNIGYTVFPPFRGHRYGAKACMLLISLAKQHGMEQVIITCDPDNTASARTCEIAGGELLESIDLPKESDMYAAGKRKVLVYRISL